MQLFRLLGLDRVHLAARVTADWRGLATTRPETTASLTLVCPTGLDATPLGALTSRVLVLTGDQGTPAEAISKAMPAHPEASIITLSDYYGHPRADLLTDRAEDIGAAMLAFLARMDQLHAVKPVRLPAQEGELDGISYRIQGAGAPLVLLPLGLAASQWEPLLPRLSAQYCTLTLGGAILGSVASLEARGRSTGYLGVVRNLIAEIHLHPGETILDVGCGSGVLDRWLARHTGGAHRITAVDIHRTLLREAAALATKEGLAEHIEFREGNAEVLPFGDNSFDSRRRWSPSTSAAKVVGAHLGVVEKLPAGAFEAVAPKLEHEAAVRDGERRLRVLLDHEHRRALPIDRDDRIEDHLCHARVKTERGLVDEQEPWVQQERDRHLENLLLAA